MIPFPTAMQLLADLAARGIEVEPCADTTRYRPRSAMTPALLHRLQAHKAELLRFLSTAAAIGERRQAVKPLWHDPAWRSVWELRFRGAHYADFASLQRVLELVIDQAAEHHRRHDWKAFASTCRYLNSLASGELWDEAEQIASKFRDLTASPIA